MVDPRTPLDCTAVVSDPGDTLVARLTRTEYVNSVRDMFGVEPEVEDLPFETRAPATTTASAQTIDILHAEVYSEVARQVADALGDLTATYGTCADFTEECEASFIQSLGVFVFGRPLHDEEVDGFRPIFQVVSGEGDNFSVAASLVLRSMLQSPQFLYHIEDLRGDGIRSIDSYELARRLAYLVWQSAPDDSLREAAAQGELDSAEQIETQVRRMLADPRSHQASLSFIEDWVDLTRLERAVSSVDADLKSQMRSETERFVEYVLWAQGGGLVDLLGSEQTFVNRDLAEIYGVSVGSDDFDMVSLQELPERRGLLTQPAVLAAHANGNRPAIVSRGLFLLRTILCRDIPNPPASVDTTLTELPETASERDKSSERLTRGSCGECHRTFDPLAYAFEPFDGSGRFRSVDDHGNATSTDGWIPAAYGDFEPGDPRGEDIHYDNLDEMIQALVDSPLVAECMSQKMLTFQLRRALNPEVLPDACAIAEVTESARGGSYADLLVAVATHPSFRMVRAR